MVHTAVGFSRMRNRLQTLACTTSACPGTTNLVTGAALATINRIPVLLLPGDVFATRASGTVLQQLESPRGHDVFVNDALRPVSVFFDRVWRPEQLPSVLLWRDRSGEDQPTRSPEPFRLTQRVAPVTSQASPRARQPRASPRRVMKTTNVSQSTVIACPWPVTVSVPASRDGPVARTVRIRGR